MAQVPLAPEHVNEGGYDGEELGEEFSGLLEAESLDRLS
jgi:hypothetical protein